MQYLKEEVKARICSAALNEFKNYGFLNSSMRNIAKNAEVCSGNIYRYFKNKEELFDEVIGPVYNKFMSYSKDMQKANENLTSSYATLQEFNNIHEMIIDLFKEYNFELLILLDKSKGSKYENTKNELIILADSMLKKALLENIDANSKFPMDETATYMLSATLVEGICIILKNHEDGTKVKYLLDELINIFSAGIFLRIM